MNMFEDMKGGLMKKLYAGILVAMAVVYLCGFGFPEKKKLILTLDLTIGGVESEKTK